MQRRNSGDLVLSNIREPWAEERPVTCKLYFHSCSPADAAACPAFVLDSVGFLFDPKPVYRQKLAKYDAPPEAVEAKLQVKECTDEIDKGKRVLIAAVLVISFFFMHIGPVWSQHKA